MSVDIIKYSDAAEWKRENVYRPVAVVIRKKLYKTSNWGELLKLLLFSCCYKTDNMHLIDREVNANFGGGSNFIVSGVEETATYVKFSPQYYVRVSQLSCLNCKNIADVYRYISPEKVDVYIAGYKNDEDLDDVSLKTDELIKDLIEKQKLKKGSTRHIIAHINGKVLSTREKFFRRIEKEFDEKTLIGDICVGPEEEEYLQSYMRYLLCNCSSRLNNMSHEKVFAFALVRYAMKYYSSKRFWPYMEEEYGVEVPLNAHQLINDKFKDIMTKYGKLYDVEEKNYIQNICMHAFVCDKCADQFFDYVFDFWRIDLSRSIENMYDDQGNDIFDVLVDEIAASVQDIMLHTSMALKMNSKGCKNRFRRILRMIDDCFWNNTDFSTSSNRLTMMFNEWKNKDDSAFAKEVKKTVTIRKQGRGEKLLSKPTLEYSSRESSFKLILHKQMLRECTEEDYPVWYVTVDDVCQSIEPELLKGKAFLFTNEKSIPISNKLIFDRIEVELRSADKVFYRYVINEAEYRFFNSKMRSIDIYDDYLSKDVGVIFVRKNSKIELLNGQFINVDTFNTAYDVYSLSPEEGDILMLPDGHAVSIGRPLVEGLVGVSRDNGVRAKYDGKEYPIVSTREKIFFKTSRSKLNGSSIKVFNHERCVYFGKVNDERCIEFKLDNSLIDVYGYIVDLSDYINSEGLYRVELGIPGLNVRVYQFCYISGFKYHFKNAPYIFKEYGTLEVPAMLNFETNNEWEINEKKSFEFLIDEFANNACPCVKERKLCLKYCFTDIKVDVEFDLPVLYWKYDANDDWLIEKPCDLMLKQVPPRVYISGCLGLSSATMFIDQLDEDDCQEIHIKYDKACGMYYFRTVDLSDYLNRDVKYRDVDIRVNNSTMTFCRIVCKSDVRSSSISGDFQENVIYGFFDIYGDSDYMVTVKYGEEIVEEDVPVKNGKFSIHCCVKEGQYTVTLYEVEDDDTGFGSISYELKKYKLDLVDIRKYSGKDIRITQIKNKRDLLEGLPLKATYYIQNLKLIRYDRDKFAELYTWKYDPTDEDEMSKFVYYTGFLGFYMSSGQFINLSKVIVVFDNKKNVNEVLINTVNHGCFCGLEYSAERGLIQPSPTSLTKYERRHMRMIDDDIYDIKVEVCISRREK